MAFAQPIELAGHGVRLTPLAPGHADGLAQAAADGRLWELHFTSVPAPGEEADYIAAALRGQRDGHMLPFAVIDEASGAVLGSTRYHDIVAAARRVEIGYTWYARRWQRSHVNTAAKLLLLTHAFETLGCGVVGWRTDVLNIRSQAAIERLGALKDGTIRHHAPRRDGSIRDTVMYSMLAGEWPAARERQRQRLAQGHAVIPPARPAEAPC